MCYSRTREDSIYSILKEKSRANNSEESLHAILFCLTRSCLLLKVLCPNFIAQKSSLHAESEYCTVDDNYYLLCQPESQARKSVENTVSWVLIQSFSFNF